MASHSKGIIASDSKGLGYTREGIHSTTGEPQSLVRLRNLASGVNATLGRPYLWQRLSLAGSGEAATTIGALASVYRKPVVATAATVSGEIGEYVWEGLCTAVASGTISAGDFVKIIGAAAHFISDGTTKTTASVGVARSAGTDGGTFSLDLYSEEAIVNT